MRKSTRYTAPRVAALCATLLAAPLAQAVSLSQGGTGQVLIYPYYTVNAGQNTLLSLVNTTPHAKALKLRFREGYNGREVVAFNLYLAGYDVWTGAVFAADDASGANLLTDDTSCTVPALRDNASLPTLGDGRHYVPFSNLAYSGAYADTGPTAVTRTREGSVEVIEMGELSGASESFADHFLGVPKDCSRLRAAWDSGGYWSTNPGTELLKPRGGLYGTLAVVNAAQGTIFEVAATALDGFSAYVQHTAPASVHPNLGDARTSTADVQPPYADADVMLDTGAVRARYVGADRTIDAVSAVLMARNLYNEYAVEPATGANTDWVVSFPTKHHYTDLLLSRAALPPFNEYFGEGGAGKSCAEFGHTIFDRKAGQPSGAYNGLPPPTNLCYVTGVIGIGSGPVSRVLSSGLTFNIPPYAANGAMRLDLDPGTQQHALRPAADGTVFHGLPVIGFGVVKYVNGNVTPGVLANYSAATPHRLSAVCTRPAGDCQ